MIPRCVLGLLALCSAVLASAPAFALDAPPPEREILVMVRQPADHYRLQGTYGGGYGDELAQSSRQRLARRIARDYGLTLVDDWPMPLMGLDCFVMAVPEGRTTAAAIDQVSRDKAVKWAQPVQTYEAQSSHNDPLYAAQPAAKQWRLAELHQLATGRGEKVAVIDSGIDPTHPDLAGQLLVNKNFVSNRRPAWELHGTGVAGIIAAKADNGVGIAGVAPGARLLGLRACWQETSGRTVCDSFSLVKALYFAINQDADVINMSLAGPDDRLLGELLKIGLDRGITVVAAYDPRRATGGFPADQPGVIAVSNTSMARVRPAVYIAPGQGVPTTEPGGRWFIVNGSSFAAAHVSGLVALLRQKRRSAALALMTDGPGRAIDACASLLRAANCDCSCGPSRTASGRVGP